MVFLFESFALYYRSEYFDLKMHLFPPNPFIMPNLFWKPKIQKKAFLRTAGPGVQNSPGPEKRWRTGRVLLKSRLHCSRSESLDFSLQAHAWNTYPKSPNIKRKTGKPKSNKKTDEKTRLLTFFPGDASVFHWF